MAKVTYKGEEGAPEPEKVEAFRATFKPGEAVEITDPDLLAKARANPNFEVEGYEEIPPDRESATWRAPSEQSAQAPVPKPGEPVRPNQPSATKPVRRI